MKNQLARLLALVCLVALIVGLVGTGTAWAQELERDVVAGKGRYRFVNGEQWGNPEVGYVCRGVIIRGKPHLVEHPNPKDNLIFIGEPGDSVYVDQVGDPAVFRFDYGENGIPTVHRYVLKGGESEPIPCTSSKSDEVTTPFRVRYYPRRGDPFQFDIVGGVGFMLEGTQNERTDTFAQTEARADSAGPVEDGPEWASLVRILSVVYDINDVNGWLDGKKVVAKIESLVLTEFIGELTRRDTPAVSGTVDVEGEARSDIPGVRTATLFDPPEESVASDRRIPVFLLPWVVRSIIGEWQWHKNGDGGFALGEERFITLNAGMTAKVTAGNAQVRVFARIKKRITRLTPKCPF